MRVVEVKPLNVEAWAISLRDGRPWAKGRALSPATVKVKTGQLRTVFQRAVDDGLLARNPAVVLKRFDTGHSGDFYVPTDEEVRALYRAACQCEGAVWLPLAVRFGVEAGLRAGEGWGGG
ncbi:hypothetical protein CUTER_09025 [Corynebacterium uterequi]|uniref:Phage integrase family protein n=1 Tax=Corynebacterium uterequi TaxID=1072256 RepID=A0A0G3HKZ6_9CORY|nr:hypothetical protein CUTER_09025 [Corynebacterium uterequi]